MAYWLILVTVGIVAWFVASVVVSLLVGRVCAMDTERGSLPVAPLRLLPRPPEL